VYGSRFGDFSIAVYDEADQDDALYFAFRTEDFSLATAIEIAVVLLDEFTEIVGDFSRRFFWDGECVYRRKGQENRRKE